MSTDRAAAHDRARQLMRARPDPKALLRAYKACRYKLDAQVLGLLTDATAAELAESLWLYDTFTLARGAEMTVTIRVTLTLPNPPATPLMIEGPKR